MKEEKRLNTTFLGLADMENPPEGYEKYIWSCDGCVKGIRWCIDHKRLYEVLPNPWEQEAKVDNTIRYLKDVREQVFKALKKEIAEYLDVKYEDDEWFILLSTWLRDYLTSCYDKFLRLQMIKNTDDLMDCYVYNAMLGAPQADHEDFFRMAGDDSYNLLLYSELISDMKDYLRNVNFIELPRDIFKMNTSHSRMSFMKKIKLNTLNAMSNMRAAISDDSVAINIGGVSYGLKRIFKFNKVQRVDLLPIYPLYNENKYNIIGTYVDKGWRKKPLVVDSDVDIFINLINKNIKKEIPLVYVESHKALSNYVNMRFGNLTNACAYVSGASFIYNEIDRLILVMMRKERKLLCGCQHGANYGVEKYWLHEDEFQVYDRYYTWGWKKKSKKFIPRPSLFFMRCRTFSCVDSNLILYVTYAVCRYLRRFSRMEVNYKKTIKDGEIQFLKSLSSDVRNRTIVRLFPDDYGWNCREEMAQELPSLRFDDNQLLHDAASRVSLVITSDWQNVFLEMLALDKPVLVLCDGSYIVDEALADVNILREVGIAHGNWDSLKKQIDEIDGRVQEWWKNPERQIVINKIKKKYAWVPENAEELWVEELKGLHRVEK